MILYLRALIKLIEDSDAKIISDYGLEVMQDEDKMKIVNKAIQSHESREPLIVKFPPQRKTKHK